MEIVMKYSLAKNCKYEIHSDKIVILDCSTHNKIELTSDMIELFKLLFIKKQDDSEIILYMSKSGVSKLDARKKINTLIYPLYSNKFIYCDNTLKYNNKKLYIHSCLIEITNYCNFRCPHCYVDKKDCNLLGFDDIKVFADELYNLHCNSITLTGGEVFSHKEFYKIYKYLFEKGFIISINTNGSLINDQILELFTEMPPCIIEISLYGYDDETYKNFTKIDDGFEKVIQNVRKLKKLDINVKLKNLITNTNKAYFLKIRDLSHQEGCLFRSDYIAFPQTKTNKINFNPEQITVDEVLTYLSRYPSCEEYYLKTFSSAKNNNKVFKCKLRDDSFFMTVDKNLHMCLCMQSFGKKYEEGKLADALLEIRKLKIARYHKNAKCKNCKYIALCRYCPGKFEMSTHDFQKPHPWFCELGKKVYEKFVAGIRIIKKQYLTQAEISKLFEIISRNMSDIGFEIGKKDKSVWEKNLENNLLRNDFFLFVIYKDGIIVGFIELGVYDEKLFLSELQLCEQVKNSRILLKTIQTLMKNDNFEHFNEIYFNINKNNFKSIKTFEHLGGECIKRNEKSVCYKIKRGIIDNYLKKVSR